MQNKAQKAILGKMETVDHEIVQLQLRLSKIISINGDFRCIYRENKLHLQQNHHLLYPFQEQLQIPVYYSVQDCEGLVQSIQKCHQDRPLIIRALAKIKAQESCVKRALFSEYQTQYKNWVCFVKEQEKQNAAEADIRAQIINNAIREDFIQAQAQLGPSPAVSAFFGRRRGPIGDVVRSEEEMNIVLRDLLEQEKRSLAARWTNTLASIPEMILCNQDHLEFRFLDSNRICDPFQVERQNKLEYQRARSWTPQEIQVFVEKYALFPKMFGKISSWLPSRSAEDCVKFYYCNKKMLHLKGSKPGTIPTAVLGSVPFPSVNFGSNSFPVVNAATAINRTTSPKQAKFIENIPSSSGKRGRKRKEEESETDLQSPDEDSSLISNSNHNSSCVWSEAEREKFALAFKLFGKNWTLITDYLDYSKRESECKEYFEGQFSASRRKQLALSNGKEQKKPKLSDYSIAVEETNQQKKKQIYSHYWTKEEKKAFSDAFYHFGKDWEAISRAIKSKSANQAKKYFKKNRHLYEQEPYHKLVGRIEEEEEERGGNLLQENTTLPIEEEIDIEEFASSPSLQDSMPVIKLPTLF